MNYFRLTVHIDAAKSHTELPILFQHVSYFGIGSTGSVGAPIIAAGEVAYLASLGYHITEYDYQPVSQGEAEQWRHQMDAELSFPNDVQP